jgi:hypothetical protein
MAANRTDPPGEGQESQLLPWERQNTDGTIEWDHEAHERWCARWAPRCPDGNPQRVGRILGFRERSLEELELRVVLGGSDLGACHVVVDEHDHEVYVRVLVCLDPDERAERRTRDYLNWPVRVWLDHPLEGRVVIDVDTGEELPLYTP